MASEKSDKQPEKKSGSSKVLLLVIIILLIVLIAGGATAWFMLHKNSPSGAESHAATASQQPAEPAVFFKLEPFTVNLSGGSYGDRLLYVHITLQLGDKATETYLQSHLPQLRNRLLMVLSNQDANDLVTREGKIKLAGQIRDSLSKPFGQDHPKLKVQDVLFTQFIVQ